MILVHKTTVAPLQKLTMSEQAHGKLQGVPVFRMVSFAYPLVYPNSFASEDSKIVLSDYIEIQLLRTGAVDKETLDRSVKLPMCSKIRGIHD